MLTGLLLLTLAVPLAPVLQSPVAEAWTIGRGGEFVTDAYLDDAGIPAAQARLEFRRDDAGYGAMEETFPYSRYLYTNLAFAPPEGARWCWRVSHLNTLNQSSAPSNELCFRVDWTPPTAPAFVDAGAVVSTGRVDLQVLPASDALSGVSGYDLELAPTPSGDWYSFPSPQLQLPLTAWVGEGNWFAWVRVSDLAGNTNRMQLGSYAVPITVVADASVPVPEAPVFESTMVSNYGGGITWDAGWMAGAGVTHVVASSCNLDAGCQWRHVFHSVAADGGSWQWLQVNDEGAIIARLAVVRGGVVGRWSTPSAPMLVDRTAPPVPPGFTAAPVLARTGPITLSWGAVTDGLTGLQGTVIEETELVSGAVRQHTAVAPAVTFNVTPPGDGVFSFRAASVDRVANQSAWSTTAEVVIDGTGPVSLAPVATASMVDGGALVSLSWSLPTDLLSGVATEELQERNDDGGTQLVSVTGLGVSRLVTPGTWRWALRATDVAGNVGAFSPPSNAIVVTAGGVAIGPSITTTAAAARCGESLALSLQGSGDAPLHWTLLSGPPGLAVDVTGQLTWTPPAGSAGPQAVQVQLSNGAGLVTGAITVTVACAESPDGGTVPPFKTLSVGCGCSSLDGALILLAVGLLGRRRR